MAVVWKSSIQNEEKLTSTAKCVNKVPENLIREIAKYL